MAEAWAAKKGEEIEQKKKKRKLKAEKKAAAESAQPVPAEA